MTVIKTNVSSLVAQQNQSRANSALETAIERLSSGLRINSAKDDAAGQAITNRLSSNIRGLNQAVKNTNDGISISQTAQSNLNEINHRLQRIRELSVQGLNGIYEGVTGDHIQAEINLNLKEIDRITKDASFNGIPLLDGTGGLRQLQVGAYDHNSLTLDLGPPGFSVQELGLWGLNIQGTPNTITPVSFLQGRSYSIPLDDVTHTTVTYSPPDQNPNLVDPTRPQSRDIIQLDGPNGRLMETRITASHDTKTKLNHVNIQVENAVLSSTVRESISSWAYLDSDGAPLSLTQANVVSSGGKYWIAHQHNGTTHYYEAELTIHGDQHRITAQAKSEMRLREEDLNTPISQPLRSAPAVTLNSADYRITLDNSDETTNTALKLVHLGGFYYVEEQLAPDQYAYYQADVVIQTGGDQNSVTVEADRSNRLSVQDQPYVSGTTTAHFDPNDPSITVNYTELSGRVHTNVMRADENGNYIFHLDESQDGQSAYKTAEVVRNKDGHYMLRTRNSGTAEVVLYYPLYQQLADGSYTSTYSVSTNVNTNQTTISLREADNAQRLRTPANPLAAIDHAIARIDAKRSELGALDNRLQSVIQINTETNIQLSAARSRIEDADYAAEVSAMTRAQILQQASTSVLAHANQTTNDILNLLRSI